MKITMKTDKTTREFFDDFLIAKRGKGVADKTIESYKSHFKCIARHLTVDTPIDELEKADLDNMVSSMRDSGNAAKTHKRCKRSRITAEFQAEMA